MNIREKLERLTKSNWHIPKEFGTVCNFGGAQRVKTPAEWVYEIVELETNYARLLAVAKAAYTYDYCNDDDVERKERLLLEMRAALAAVEDLL